MIWLLGLLLQIKLVFGTSGECDPDLNKHWYPVQNESTKFFFCHPTKKVYQLDECGSESGIQKEFDFLLQKCALRNKTFNSNLSDNNLSHPPRHSFGTIPNLSTIGQKILGRLPEPPRTRYEFDELQCPQGRNALKLKGKPVECSAAPGQDDPSVLHCGPDGHFRCSFFSKIGDRGICCEKLEKKQIKCPPRMGPVMEKDGNARACNPRRVGSCRTEGSVCVFDEEQGDFHCCQVDMSEYEDEEDELEASTMNYLAIGMTNQLRPPKYIGRPRKYSKDIEEINGCRGGEIPFLDQNKGAMECTADKVTCPPGFQCYRSRRFQRYICCGMNRGYCPSNSAVLMGPKQRKVSCGTLSGCPEGFYCHKSSHTCCSLEPTAGICEQGLPFINSDGKARYCEQSCPKGYTCTKRFRKSVCCPSTEHVCSQPVNIGLHCLIAKSKKFFFYHSESGECRPFIYTGCSGNDNRFETIRQCEDHCHLASICPVGSALRLANGNMATCSEHQPCPLDEYSCHSTDRGNFCCPNIENFEICPADQKPYIVKGRPVECHKSSECPNSFECHRPNYHSMGHCCAQPPPPVPMPSPLPIIRNLPKARPIYTPRCSNNKAPLKAPDDEIQICIPGKELECPNGYFCELDDYLGRYQCCPTNSPTVGYQSTCSSGFDIHLDSEGAPVFCDPEEVVTSCHKFGECKYSQEHENFVCCAPNSLEGMLKIENNSSPKLWSGILPGGHGCISDTQCEIIFPNARCDKGRCKCPGNLKAYQGKCEADCPQDYAEIDGICLKESTKRTKT